MGYFGYEFIDRTPELVAERRVILNWYATLAQLSQFIVLLAIPTFQFLFSILLRFLGSDSNSSIDHSSLSPSLRKKESSTRPRSGFAGLLSRSARIIKWRLGTEVIHGWGTYGEWLFGLLWAAWLGFLCVSETAPDYMHVTKRFGIVGASQLPIHYLLAMKHPYSPLQLMLKSSHEFVIAWHQVTGRIIITLFTLHATFYVNFFVRKHMFWSRAGEFHITVGIISILIFLLIGFTSTGFFRRRKYSSFYLVHVVGSSVVLLLLFFHVHHIRVYVFEAAAVLTMNFVLRMFSSRKFSADIATIPRSNGLVKISIKHPGGFVGGWLPGEHVYFRDHNSATWSYFAKNPFTISTLPSDGRDVVLVAKRLNGNTRLLHSSASLAERNDEIKVTTNVSLEGPYGYSRYLTGPKEFSRVLFVAGGVGATYILPMWRFFHQARTMHQEIRFVWVVRTTADAEWAFETLEESTKDESFEIDERELFLTGTRVSSSKDNDEEAIELLARDDLDQGEDENESTAVRAGFVVRNGRPDLRMTVDVTISGNPGRSAVFVCGPTGMIENVRRNVGKWVERGEDVFFHAEEFRL